MERIFIYGAGGQGKVVIDGLEAGPQPYAVGFIADDNIKLQGETLRGHPITSPEVIREERGIVAIGDNQVRMAIAARYPGKLVSFVHPRAWIAPGVELGEGTVVLAAAIVGSDAKIGQNVIVNTSATIDHDCVIGNGVHIAPGCHLCGNVHVGAGTLLGVGTLVRPGVRIGRNVFVHAGNRLSKDIPDGEIVRA